ncbi:dephospho-CoA kinase [Azonexus sp. R2A61]|uniref:dephospho-CoA kinase n=1 Tax=Azonexus sp. R2A61 TaxID=2744443 RepID=UPI001EEC1FFD|nr:dephospho-CoA kinase [Azonexus sp. R2A61]
MSRYVVGLTGGIGSGKSTVADAFVAQGAALVDTDAIAHELTAPQGAAMPELIAAFGDDIVDADGALDRAAMRRRVFADPAARGRLEAILHPRIRALSAERVQAASAAYAILAVPLLVESGQWQTRCDRVLVVDCPEAVQIERVGRRSGLSADEVRAIMAAQASREQRLAVADDIVRNDGERTNLYRQVAALHLKYLELAAEKT